MIRLRSWEAELKVPAFILELQTVLSFLITVGAFEFLEIPIMIDDLKHIIVVN